jgi:hypothetical protein
MVDQGGWRHGRASGRALPQESRIDKYPIDDHACESLGPYYSTQLRRKDDGHKPQRGYVIESLEISSRIIRTPSALSSHIQVYKPRGSAKSKLRSDPVQFQSHPAKHAPTLRPFTSCNFPSPSAARPHHPHTPSVASPPSGADAVARSIAVPRQKPARPPRSRRHHHCCSRPAA